MHRPLLRVARSSFHELRWVSLCECVFQEILCASIHEIQAMSFVPFGSFPTLSFSKTITGSLHSTWWWNWFYLPTWRCYEQVTVTARQVRFSAITEAYRGFLRTFGSLRLKFQAEEYQPKQVSYEDAAIEANHLADSLFILAITERNATRRTLTSS